MSTTYFVNGAGDFYHGSMKAGDRVATGAELAAHTALQRIETARGNIERLEREQLMPRATREFILLSMEAQATPEALAGFAAYVKMKAFDTEIAGWRAIIRGEA